MGNACYEQKNLHKYTKVARGQDRVEVKWMIDLGSVKKDMVCYEQDVRAVRGKERGLSDHHVALHKVRLVDGLNKRREVGLGVRN